MQLSLQENANKTVLTTFIRRTQPKSVSLIAQLTQLEPFSMQ
jgi:hypothetical protein